MVYYSPEAMPLIISAPASRHVCFQIMVKTGSFICQRALADVKDLFDLAEVKTWLLERGLEWLDERQGLAEAQQQRAALEAGGPGHLRA